MSHKNLISVNRLCEYYQVEISLFSELQEFGIIQLTTIKDTYFIKEDHISDVERVVRLKKDLNINLEGIDTILNLLNRIQSLQNRLTLTTNRLKLYED